MPNEPGSRSAWTGPVEVRLAFTGRHFVRLKLDNCPADISSSVSTSAAAFAAAAAPLIRERPYPSSSLTEGPEGEGSAADHGGPDRVGVGVGGAAAVDMETKGDGGKLGDGAAAEAGCVSVDGEGEIAHSCVEEVLASLCLTAACTVNNCIYQKGVDKTRSTVQQGLSVGSGNTVL